MPKITISYNVQSCPQCGKRLLKVETGYVKIGSPLIQCKKCNVTYRTNLRQEWCMYKPKWYIFRFPMIFAILGLLCGLTSLRSIMGIYGNIIVILSSLLAGALIGFLISIPDWIRVLRSEARVRKLSYLHELLAYNAITLADYQRLSKKAK